MTKNSDSTPPRRANRLAHEKSPYLLQHQYNPVDWHPWGEEAFERARAENKPLLISIGYSACHWCHVMEHESFSNEAIARAINETVIPVKVDREERPDVDAIYMEACMAMSGHGGWPLNAFVTPELKPFFVGTYFPPNDMQGRPGFMTVLQKIREAWITDGAGLARQAENLHQQLEQYKQPATAQPLAPDLAEDIVRDSASMYDLRHGGFGSAPKFPPDTRLALLLSAYKQTGDESALRMVTGTLDAMACGGIYDQIAGGFARYSVDARWLIPHFEKMLYNQALLIPVYVDAWLVTQSPLYKRIARESADWVLEELSSAEGLFQCAYDADSEGEEGKFYVWTPDQIKQVLPDGDDAELFCAFYGITPRGNFEHGTSNPHITVAPEDFAKSRGISAEQWQERLAAMRNQVRKARAQRPWPGLDDKCLTGWNGLMISALCRLAQSLDETRYVTAAQTAAEVLLQHQRNGDTLLRVFKDGQSSIRGTLDDYAFFADALIDLYETTFEARWLDAAREICNRMTALFQDVQNGGFYFTDGMDKTLITRTRDNYDGALPASASVAVKALLRLARFDRNEEFEKVAQRAVAAEGRRANTNPLAYASLVLAQQYASPALPEITITASSPASASELTAALYHNYLPARVVTLNAGAPAPAMALEKPVSDNPRIYVCKNNTCLPPVESVEALQDALS